MKRHISLFALALTGTLAVSACTNLAQPQATEGGEAASDVAQDSMPGMDHGNMTDGSMSLGPKDESFDLRFIDAMIPHHEGAVVMAKEALEKSSRSEIRALAEAIIAAQEQEIAEMKEWRSAWYPSAPSEPVMYSAEMGHTMAMSEEMRSGMMMNMDLGAADAEFDLRFINAMIPHHEGAVVMAQEALEKSDRPEIRALAETIITSQQAEIDQMNQWKQDWYGQS
jgi:uncharacterized protein (DUF305 family)